MTPPNRPYAPTQSKGSYPGKDFGQKRGQGETTQLPTPVRVQYYKDPGKQNLDPDLLDARAAEWAKDFRELKSAQMRRFYDELKAIERKIMIGKDNKEQEVNFARDRALIVLFKAKAVYAEKRRVSPPAFTQFIFNQVASIDDLKDFKAFLKVFEAVVAFHKFFSPEK